MPGFRRARVCEPPPAPLAGGLTAFSACDESVSQAGCHAPGPLRSLAILLTHAGRADSWADGVAAVHRPRRLIAVAEGAIYEERLPPGAWWHLSYLLLRGSWCEPLNQALARRAGGVLVVDQAPVGLRALLSATVESALGQPPRWPWSATANLAGLMGELLARTQEVDTSLSARVAQLVDQDPERAWTIPAVAGELRLSLASFTRHFTAEAGMAPARWLRHRRIDQARRLLGQNLTVAVVAERLGFANPYHFSRVFKAITGIPPSQARPATMVSLLHSGGIGDSGAG